MWTLLSEDNMSAVAFQVAQPCDQYFQRHEVRIQKAKAKVTAMNTATMAPAANLE